jgi:hypothetical protein
MGVLLLGGAARAQSSSEPQVWQGEAFITGFTTGAAMSACTAQGTVSVGDYFLTIYRPIIPGSPNNPSTSDEGLSFFGGRNGLHYYTADGVSFSKPGNSYLEYLSTHAQSSGMTTGSASVPFNLKITPAAITLTTPTIGIKGSIDDWENTSGCDVTFTASLVERVD